MEWAEVLHPQVRHLPTRVVSIDAENRTVVLADLEPLRFDWLVYAVGSGEQATPLLSVTNPAAAEMTGKAIADLAPGAAVTVAGAGPTGVEVACAVAVSRPDLAITVVAPSGLAHPLTGRLAVAHRLQRLGITVEDGAVNPATGAVTAADGSRRSSVPALTWQCSGRETVAMRRTGAPTTATQAESPCLTGKKGPLGTEGDGYQRSRLLTSYSAESHTRRLRSFAVMQSQPLLRPVRCSLACFVNVAPHRSLGLLGDPRDKGFEYIAVLARRGV